MNLMNFHQAYLCPLALLAGLLVPTMVSAADHPYRLEVYWRSPEGTERSVDHFESEAQMLKRINELKTDYLTSHGLRRNSPSKPAVFETFH